MNVYFCIFDSIGLIIFQTSLNYLFNYARKYKITWLLFLNKFIPPILKLNEINLENEDKIELDMIKPKVDILLLYVDTTTYNE